MSPLVDGKNAAILLDLSTESLNAPARMTTFEFRQLTGTNWEPRRLRRLSRALRTHHHASMLPHHGKTENVERGELIISFFSPE